MRFIIVDDADEPLHKLWRMLEEAGHTVVGVARNGVEAILKYRELQPDVLVMDVIMPRMNGMEALRAIRAEFPEARVILTCALNSCDTVLEAEENGAAFCLFKPFSLECVTNAIAQLDPTGKDKAPKEGEAKPAAAKRGNSGPATTLGTLGGRV